MDPELLRQTSGFDFLFAWGWAFVLGLTILLWPVTRASRAALLWLWLAKTVVALLVMLPYEEHYLLDAYYYFLSGQFTPLDAGDVTIGNGTQVMLFLSGVHSSILPISYHAEKVTCAYVGLIAIYQLYMAALTQWPGLGIRALYVLGLFPSVLFWTSILGKDPLVLLGIGLFVRGVVSWYARDRASSLLVAAAGVALCAVFRSWLAPILTLPLAVFLLLRVRTLWARVAFMGVLAVGLAASAQFFLQYINAESTTDVLDYSNQVAHSWQAGGSGQQLDTQFTSVWALLGFLPLGMFTALFRPLPGEIFSPFAFLASLENGFIVVLFVRAVIRFRREELRQPILLWMVSFVLVWSAAYGIACYQNLGTSVRFRLQILPLFLGLLFYLGRKPGSDWSVAREDDQRSPEPEPLEERLPRLARAPASISPVRS